MEPVHGGVVRSPSPSSFKVLSLPPLLLFFSLLSSLFFLLFQLTLEVSIYQALHRSSLFFSDLGISVVVVVIAVVLRILDLLEELF